MSYSACLEWFEDWVSVEKPILLDKYDLSYWMEEMIDAKKMFL